MRIHGIMLVKDEGDVIGETLEAAVGWCDAIYAFDNGSSDGTWELIQEAAAKSEQVVPFKQDTTPFTQSLRGEIFRHYRPRVRPGDWWCILDGDEIYIDNPRTFLAQVPAKYGEVWNSSFQYYFTDADLERYEADPEAFHRASVQERMRYYLNNWSESRFMRHHDGLVWPPDRPGEAGYRRPLGLGPVYPRRIRLKHYQYRSPEQMDARLQSRMAITSSYRHERRPDWLTGVLGRPVAGDDADGTSAPTWRDRIVPARYLDYDDGSGHYVEHEAALPPLPRDRYGVRRAKRQAQATLWRLRERVSEVVNR